MDDKLSCPYCGSPEVRLLEAIYTVRVVERPKGGGFVERRCQVCRCLDCGRTFDEVEAMEGPELEEDDGPSFY